jgi:hypothetical protein
MHCIESLKPVRNRRPVWKSEAKSSSEFWDTGCDGSEYQGLTHLERDSDRLHRRLYQLSFERDLDFIPFASLARCFFGMAVSFDLVLDR